MTRFRNPPASPAIKITPWMLLRYAWSRVLAPPLRLGIDIPEDLVLSRQEILEGLAISGDALTWLGHSSFLLRLGDTAILTDPFLWGSAGPRMLRALRRIPLPITAEDLPKIDLLLISHGHEDHFHRKSIATLQGKPGMTAVVPTGLGKRMRKCGITATELGWHAHFERSGIRVTAVPAIHYSEPGLNRTLWAGFVIEYPGGKIFFSGDTGYGPVFSSEIMQYGPFDVAIVGVGAYFRADNPNSQTHLVHATPEEAVRIAKDMGASSIIGMHWGTARMADESADDVRMRFEKAAAKNGLAGHAHLFRIGETRTIGQL